MTFNSVQFAAFFVVVLAVYHQLDRRGQNLLVFVAGSIFYGAFDWRFLGLLYFSIGVDYVVGRRLSVTEDTGARKRLFAVSLVCQLGILATFKYFNFFIDSAGDLLDTLGFDWAQPAIRVALPVGISFYTFQTLAYVRAVYKRQLDAEHDLVTFAAFVAWFPQLVAGPIEKAQHLLPQIRERRSFPEPRAVDAAVTLLVRGLFKKVVVADGLASYVATVFAGPDRFGAIALALAALAFAIQVYGDFSGYSDIARGTSRLLGVELRRNFEQPFLSRDIQEFWLRWHTSLSSWFTDFVAVPLGGARKGPRWRIVVTLVVFGLSGLWHGASWNFVVWGLLNGVLVAARRRPPARAGKDAYRVRWTDAPKIAFTIATFSLGAVFFRAGSLEDALTIFERIFTLAGGARPPAAGLLVPVMLAVVLGLDLLERRQRLAGIAAFGSRTSIGSVARPEEVAEESLLAGGRSLPAGVLVGAMVLGVVVFSGGTATPFIYFQF